jgi:hypothetical protein
MEVSSWFAPQLLPHNQLFITMGWEVGWAPEPGLDVVGKRGVAVYAGI